MTGQKWIAIASIEMKRLTSWRRVFALTEASICAPHYTSIPPRQVAASERNCQSVDPPLPASPFFLEPEMDEEIESKVKTNLDTITSIHLIIVDGRKNESNDERGDWDAWLLLELWQSSDKHPVIEFTKKPGKQRPKQGRSDSSGKLS